MNIIPLLTYYLISSNGNFTELDNNLDIADSLIYVIEKFIKPKSASFFLLMANERSNTIEFYSDLLRLLFGKQRLNIKTHIVLNGKSVGPTIYGERLYNIMLIDSWQAFLKIDPASKVQNYDINEFYHIFLKTDDQYVFDDMQIIFDYCWKNYIINVNIQVQKSSGEIIIYSYFPFAKTHCRKVIPVEINRFENGKMRNKQMFPPKLQDLFDCPLRVATYDIAPYLTLDLTKKGRDIIGGFEGKLLNQLSLKMNFDIEVVVPPKNELRGVIYGNLSTGAVEMLRKKEADLSIGCIWFSENRSRVLTATDTYLQSKNMPILMDSSTNFKPDLALWFPFEPEAAKALLAAFLATITLFYIWTRFQAAFWKFIPTNKPNICLNYLAYTLGTPPSAEPIQNSKRIFITTWVLFVLVIRTKYGAIIYHLIRNNIFLKPPSTIDELIKLNYTFVLNRHGWNEMGNMGVFKDMPAKKITLENIDNFEVFQYLEQNKNEKLFTAAPIEFILDYLGKGRKIGVLKTLKEAFMHQNVCIYLTKHSFLADRLNTFILRTNAVGLMDNWVEQAIDFSFFRIKRPPKQITIGLQQLDGVLYLCGFMLAIASVTTDTNGMSTCHVVDIMMPTSRNSLKKTYPHDKPKL
ncbi:uncharacterized protein LOC129944778 [Eupeodes corollae]|uniref:uncharacterized protein LOC129944778 n=1 Tax=Eupeodes corollae TaxID=290404 RepID=UPI002492F410|nr:uncharacterized protein LOC129944778 [Eupeodes corollae]